jgi:uncharacterized membrane protein YagU involved in acid resistance
MALAVERTVTQRDRIVAGLAAGIVGGILIQLFLFAVQLAGGAPPDKIVGDFAFIASAMEGPGAGAYASPLIVAIGIVVHLCISAGWAVGYAFLARTQPHLLTRPLISGAGFGLIVYIFVQIVLLTAPQHHGPAAGSIATQLLAYMVFYGIPVALIVARMLRGSTGSAAA